MKTVSFEMAQRLKEEGWDKPTYWNWAQYKPGWEWEIVQRTTYEDYVIRAMNFGVKIMESFPAPDLSELLEYVTFGDIRRYWMDRDGTSSEFATYITMSNPDDLAEVWLYSKGRQDG